MENGVPLQGTWTKAFEEVDLLSVLKPYHFPIPKSFKASRIKEWETFIVQDDRFLLHARLCNLKYYRTAFLLVYNKESKEKLEFKKAIPGGAWRLPRNLNNASVDSHSMNFFFRIHTWLDTNSIKLELNVGKRRQKPDFTTHFTFDLADLKTTPKVVTTPMVVSLLFSDRRNMYAYKAQAAVEGDMVLSGRHIHFDPAKTTGVFCDFKGYYPYQMRCAWCTSMWFDDQGRRITFALGENQARESYRNNENALWIDGNLTPLPPVRITHSGNSNSDWIIQDMEGMVDLVFTPREPRRDTANYIVSTSDYENPLGVFNGFVIDSKGEKLQLHNVWGAGEKLYLRV